MHIHLTPTALAKAKAIGVIAAALTAGGAGGMIALSQVSNTASSTEIVNSSDSTNPPTGDPTQSVSPSDSESPTPTPTATGTDAAAAPASTTAAPGGSYTLPSCPADVKDHGAYVSGVAHSAPKGAGGEHGKAVSAAAHSDCGRAKDAAGTPEPTETDSPESHSPQPAHTHESKSDEPSAKASVRASASESSSSAGKHKFGHSDH